MPFASLVRNALLERCLPAAPESAPSATLRQRLYRGATFLVRPSGASLRGSAERPTRSDEALLEAFLQGDADAFEALMDQHLGWMRAWACKHLPPADADDAAQEAFIALVRKGADLRLGSSLRSLLFGLLRIEVLRAIRDTARRRGEPLEDERSEEDTLVDTSPNPEMALLSQRMHQEVAEALHDACTLREQEVILFTLEGSDDRTIAATLELSEGNVRVVRHRALRKLREALGATSPPDRTGSGHER